MECGRSLFQVVIELLVVHQRSHGSLARIDLGGYGVQMGRGRSCVLDGLLTAIEDRVRLCKQYSQLQRRHTLDGLAITYLGLPCGSKRNGHELIAQDSFGFN